MAQESQRPAEDIVQKLERLIEEAKRIQREADERLRRLRRGGAGDHTDGTPPKS